MKSAPDFDLPAAHRYFAAQGFNQAWDLIDKPDRTAADDEQMIRLCLASQYHWSQRDDRTPKNESIGFWQASRVYALVGQAENARRYGNLCLEASRGDGVAPFYLAYAFEALARAEALAGSHAAAKQHLAEARRIAEQVTDVESKTRLIRDLDDVDQSMAAASI